ncbi:MAG: TadE/TadG family protein [Rhizobiales bacterium]|nr:TadE/TadG family protein [Hyphomicrobiales bacterium]
MFGKSLLNSAKRAAADLVHADRGNVAVMFAVALVPMLGIVGTAIDYSRAVAARSAMQAALDTVALMVSKDAQKDPSITTDQATKAAEDYFKALYKEGDVSNIKIEATYTPNTGKGASVEIKASASVATDFMRYAGYTDMKINTGSETKWGAVRMRVAMVLDNTGSMADNGKMTKMRTAAKDMVTKLAALAKNQGDVYISLIPFAKNVNLGSGFDQSYIKWSGQSDTWDENNGSCSAGSFYKTKAACTSVFVCSDTRYTSQRQCQNNNKTWGNAVWTPSSHNNWSGCVMDRDQDKDISNEAPVPGDTNAASTLFPAQEYTQGRTNYCDPESSTYLQPIIPMTDPKATQAKNSNKTEQDRLTDAIDAMDPTGGTNQAIGIAWGWQSLSTTNGPIAAPAKERNYTYQDYMVILSDGLNTQNRWPSYGNGQSQSTCGGEPCIDARQKKLCDAIKNDNIKVFTIQVNINKADPTSTILQDCASPGSGNFQEITRSNDIAGAFDNILLQITRLQISQ